MLLELRDHVENDDGPSQERHGDQEDGDKVAHLIALIPKICEREICLHV